jgi:PIN domain nuclease of toxin-antitoxin system
VRVLLDTCALIWFYGGNEAMAVAAREIIADQVNDVLFSEASLWEIAIKHRLGKLALSAHATMAAAQGDGMVAVPIGREHILRVEGLPRHHRDPFDHLIIAQAQVLGCAVMTDDADFARYGVEVLPCR